MLELRNVSRLYGPVQALQVSELTIPDGAFLAVRGPSGSGKSTLLAVLGLLEAPSSGAYRIDGQDASRLPDAAASRLRNHTFGFIFQQFWLHPELTARENVERPLAFRATRRRERRERAMTALERVGLTARATHLPSQLSGGEQQRVAIARALVGAPKVILADEPTGNLPQTQWEPVLDLLQEANASGTSVIIVTHDDRVAARAREQVFLRDGSLVPGST